MKIPGYIQTLLRRCEWAVEAGPGRLPKECDPGYTVLLHKRTAYSLAQTLEQEARTLKGWCDRQMMKRNPDYDPEHSVAVIHHCPSLTHHNDQWAVITIYDPIMQNIEKLIPPKTKK